MFLDAPCILRYTVHGSVIGHDTEILKFPLLTDCLPDIQEFKEKTDEKRKNMMNYKKIRIVSAILAVLLIAAVMGNIFLIMNNRAAVWNVIAIAELFAMLFGLFYVFVGCTKETGAPFFIVCMILQALVYFLLVSLVPNSTFGVMLMLIKFGCLCLLSFAKDLGKKKSFTISFIYVAACVISMFEGIRPETFTPAALASLIARTENLILAVSTLLMVAAKYYDKAARGK